jgi:hypothetical protein
MRIAGEFGTVTGTLGYTWSGTPKSYATLALYDDAGSIAKPAQSVFETYIDAYNAANDNKDAILSGVQATAASAVGSTLGALTAAQRNALIACMLYKLGGIDPDTGLVAPLGDWLERR